MGEAEKGGAGTESVQMAALYLKHWWDQEAIVRQSVCQDIELHEPNLWQGKES